MAGEKPKITLEGYLDYFCNPDRRGRLTVDELNQIVFMHGFIKLHRAHKSVILDALRSLDLMPPTRSTIRDPSSLSRACTAGSPLSLEEVRQDVQVLGWQECPMGSVVTVNTEHAATPPPPPLDLSLMLTEAVPISVFPVRIRSPAPVMDAGSSEGANKVKKRKKMAAAADALLALSVPERR